MNIHEYKKMYDIEENYWWFAAKRKIIIDLIKTLKTDKSGKILDVGCGTGIMIKSMKEILPTYGIDFSLDGIKFCRNRGINKTLIGNVMNLPLPDNSFEIVTCFDLLEHFEDDYKAVRELTRVCRKGGYIIATVPAYQWLWSIHDVSLQHKRRYSISSFKKLLQSDKFIIKRISYYNALLFPPIFVTRKLKQYFDRSKEVKSDFYIELPDIINRILFQIFKAESHILNMFDLPFGLSIIAVCKKK